MTAPTAKIEEGKHQTDDCNQKNWAISIQKKLDELPLWSSYSIFSAPQNLREMDGEAFRPKIISIGPLHRRCRRLQPMQAHKLRFLHRCLVRTGSHLELFIKTISKLVDRARTCYADRTNMISDQEFMEMMLLDSIFILELLIAFARASRGEGDALFCNGLAVPQIRRDMLLFENQIPLFVLEELFLIIAESDHKVCSVSQLARFFFNATVPGNKHKRFTPTTGNKDEEGSHLLHVFRQSLITSPSRPLGKLPVSYPRPSLMMRCVSSLRDSGVKFKKRLLRKLTDIKFERGVLEIPALIVDDTTKSFFLNLIAFEKCHWECREYQISSYIAFMNGLINTPHDVAYLQQKGIIVHRQVSKKDVAQLFHYLSRVIDIDIDYYMYDYHIAYSELEEYLSRKRTICRASLELASLKRQYFSHPWSIISVVAAVLMIGLTLTQSLYSILSYHVGHS